MTTPYDDMNDKVKAAIAALFSAHMDGDIACLRIEFITPEGQLCGLYTDMAMAREDDAITGIDLISEHITNHMKDKLVVANVEHDGVLH